MHYGCILAIPKAPGYRAGIPENRSCPREKDRSQAVSRFCVTSIHDRFAICDAGTDAAEGPDSQEAASAETWIVVWCRGDGMHV